MSGMCLQVISCITSFLDTGPKLCSSLADRILTQTPSLDFMFREFVIINVIIKLMAIAADSECGFVLQVNLRPFTCVPAS